MKAFEQDLKTFLLSDVLSPHSRLFWGYLLFSVVLVVVAKFFFNHYQRPRIEPRALWRGLGVDFFYYLLGLVIKFLWSSLLGGSGLVLAAAVGAILTLLDVVQFEKSAVGLALYTLVLFLADDFTRYLLHRGLHSRWLWPLHRVHHSATVLTPLTLHRIHPLEGVLYQARSLLVFGGVSGAFYYLFQESAFYEILGVNALVFCCQFFGANLRHSHIPFSFGRLEGLLISPAQHQIHHGEDGQGNFGAFLSVWDRLGGSFIASHERPHIDRFGVRA